MPVSPITCNFSQFLCNHKMATSFARYMHSIYAEEELEVRLLKPANEKQQKVNICIIQFWLDVELFRLDGRRCKRQLARDIYERYLMRDSEQQIHVDSDVLEEVAALVESPPSDPFDCKLFDRAQDAIEVVLVTDCLHKFKEILSMITFFTLFT